MSSFEVKVRKVTISPHENADALEIGQIDGYQFIVGNGDFKTGDLGVYIPEQAIVPPELITEMNLEGRLNGAAKNRVKAVKLRGVVSQGLFYKPSGGWPENWAENTDVAEDLGITKFEPVIPQEMRGEIKVGTPNGIFRTYTDIENIKKFPESIKENEPVFFSEKLHGTCHIASIINGERFISSKGIAGRYLTLEESGTNVYWKAAKQFNLFEKLEALCTLYGYEQVILYGEVIGVQDLMYGLEKGQLAYKAFDIYTKDGFLDYDKFIGQCALVGIPTVPLVYAGPFNQEVLQSHTSGQSTMANHIREGVVVRPVKEATEGYLGRKVLKAISPDYLLRKGNNLTEFN
jgi:RNA ligase (TIGR02306 family)